MQNNEKRAGFLRRTAKEVRNYNVTMKILQAALVVLLILVGILYMVSALYKHTGSFTISVDKIEMTKYGLTLSESRDMTHQTSHLNAEIAEDITNIAEEWLPDTLDSIDGEHNGDDYIAYTFYLQNAGEVEVSYEYSLYVSNITQSLDEAIRIRLYVDGVPTTYGKIGSDGQPERGTTPFYSGTTVTQARIDAFEPGEVTKYTVVVWIEGNDPDCIDWLIGGKIKIAMDMSIVH